MTGGVYLRAGDLRVGSLSSENTLPVNLESVRADFPILSRTIGEKPLVYLDNAATTQKPRVVIDALSRFFEYENANIHRGVHYLSMAATDAYDRARARIARHIGATNEREVVFVRGATEAVNLVAASFGERFPAGGEIVITGLEHHANIVPWQLLAGRRGLTLKVVPVTDNCEIDPGAFRAAFSGKTCFAAFTHVSNAIGTINPVEDLTRIAKEFGVPVLIDGAQAAPHFRVNVADLGCDFYVFSGHKVFGPDGIGVLWGRADLLDSMPPYQGGGDMIERVSYEKTTFRQAPERFEAGTPNISGAIGLGAAIEYLDAVGWEVMAGHERELVSYATGHLREIDGVRILGPGPESGKVGVISFVMDSAHPHDIGTILDTEGIAIRAGHHCAQPLMERLGIAGTARASFAFYNTLEEVDQLAAGIRKVKKFFG